MVTLQPCQHYYLLPFRTTPLLLSIAGRFDFPLLYATIYFIQMTIYFRPDRIEYSYPTTAQETFHKDDHQIFEISLGLHKIVQEKTTCLIDYKVDEVNHDFLHKNHFIGLSAKSQFQLQVIHKNSHEERQTAIIDFNEQISNFKGCKNDLFTKEFSLGNYRIYCTYGFNKFLQVCGMSRFYEFTIEPVGILAEKVKKIKNQTFLSASKGLLNNEQRVQKQVDRQASEIREKRNHKVVQQRTAVKQDRPLSDQSQHQKALLKPSQVNLFSQQIDRSNIRPQKKSKAENQEELKFYKGPCKTSNFFSCLDPKLNISKQYHFIEQSLD